MVHVCLPGQGEDDADMEGVFPDLGQLGMSLVSVLDHLRINRVVVLGEGAGANIAARFAANHQGRVAGLVLLNCKHAVASFPLKLKVTQNKLIYLPISMYLSTNITFKGAEKLQIQQ